MGAAVPWAGGPEVCKEARGAQSCLPSREQHPSPVPDALLWL